MLLGLGDPLLHHVAHDLDARCFCAGVGKLAIAVQPKLAILRAFGDVDGRLDQVSVINQPPRRDDVDDALPELAHPLGKRGSGQADDNRLRVAVDVVESGAILTMRLVNDDQLWVTRQTAAGKRLRAAHLHVLMRPPARVVPLNNAVVDAVFIKHRARLVR